MSDKTDDKSVKRTSGWLCKGILPTDEASTPPPVDSKPVEITQAQMDCVIESVKGLFNGSWREESRQRLAVADINRAIQSSLVPTGEISDGYHTFDELYAHRIELYLKLAEMMYWNTRDNTIHRDTVWCSKLHSDGTSIDGWFVLGINQKPGEQITYHLPMKYWDRACQHVVKVLDKAPEFDGHTSGDVLERLRRL